MQSNSHSLTTALLLTAAALTIGLTSAGALADTTVTSTLDSSSLSTAGTVTLNGGELDFSTSGSWDNAFVITGSGTYALGGYSPTLSGVISGSGNVTVSGSASSDTLTLSGNNSYTGTTTISTATLVLTGTNKSTEYDVTSDAVLQIGNDTTTGSISGNVVNSGSVIFNRSNDYVYSGVISGTGTVEISTGRVAFTGTNTYTGVTTIDSGASLFIGNSGTTGSVAGNIADNGALYFNRSNSYTYSGVISGTGTVEVTQGTVYLTGENTYTGETTIDDKADLYIGNGGTTGSIAGDVVDNGELFFNRTDDISYAGDISGDGDVEIIGGGSVTLTGTNTYTGKTEIEDGTLIVGSSTAMSANSSVEIAADGTLNLNGYDSTIKKISGAGAVTLGSGDLTISSGGSFSGVISGSGSLTLSDGSLVLTGTNTYTGGTTIDSGAKLYLGDGSTAGSVAGNIVDNGALYFYSSDGQTYAGDISGIGTVGFAGGGTFILTGANTYTGDTTIYSGTTLQIGIGGTTGSIVSDVVDNGQLAFEHSDSLTYAGDISGSGNVNIGSGTITFSGSNSYTGTTQIDATLIAGSSTALSSKSDFYITSGGTLDLNDYDATLTEITGSGSVTLGSGTLTVANSCSSECDAYFSGVISGSGGLTLSSGQLFLAGENTYTGDTTIASGTMLALAEDGSVAGNIINNGQLLFVRSSSLTYSGVISGSGSVQYTSSTVILTGTNTYTGGSVIVSGATLQIGNGGTTGSVTGNLANDGTLIFDRSNSITYAGVISGIGAVAFADGTTILTGSNTYTGGTTVDSGATLQIGNGGTSGAITGDIVDNGSVIFDRSDAVTYDGVISGTGSLEVADGSLTLTGANTYTGGTTIDSGASLYIGDGGTTGSVTGDIADNGALYFYRSDSVSYDGVISGTGSVTVSSGTVILTGTNTYSGGTTIASGATLQVGDGGSEGAITGNVADNGTLSFDRSGDVSFSGNISGSGALVIDGGGTFTLSGTNTYSGTTTITDGTLIAGSAGAIPSGASVSIASAATLDLNGYAATVSALSGSGAVALGSADLTITGDSSYDGVISGTGGLTVSGGSVVLNGVNTYTGTTTVSGGTLTVGDEDHTSASIAGNVTVESGATLKGHGTIGGDVDNSDGGTVIPGGSVGTLTIDGDYTQGSGSTLEITVDTTGASELSVAGTATLAGTLQLDFADGVYSSEDYTLISAGSFSGTFSTVSTTGTSDNALYSLSYGSTGVSLAVESTQIGQVYSDLTTAQIDNAHMLNGMILDHASDKEGAGMTVWGRAFGGTGSYDSHGDSNPFSQHWAGVLVGADYQDENKISYGLSFAFHRAMLGVKQESLYGDVRTSSYTVALRAGVPFLNAGRINGDVYYISNDSRVRRYASSDGPVSHPDSKIWGGAVQADYTFGDFRPLIRFSYAHDTRDAVSESGTSEAMSVASRSYNSFRASVAVNYSHDFELDDDMILTPEANVGIEGEMMGSSRSARVKLEGDASSWVTPDYAKTDDATALFGLGTSLHIGSQTALYIRANGRVGGNNREGMLSFGGSYTF